MENRESANIGDKINDFIQRNRKVIFSLTAVVIVLFAGAIIYFAAQDYLLKNAIADLEQLNSRYDELRFFAGDENYTGEINSLIADLNAFAEKKPAFAGSRAWDLAAKIHASREEWQQAEDAWVKSAVKGNKTYLAPLSYANAAVAAEEQGKLSQAIEYLQKAIAHPFEFPGAARAQFNIGRLYEKMGDNSAAIENYRMVMINYANIPVWQNLARSAILAIEIR